MVTPRRWGSLVQGAQDSKTIFIYAVQSFSRPEPEHDASVSADDGWRHKKRPDVHHQRQFQELPECSFPAPGRMDRDNFVQSGSKIMMKWEERDLNFVFLILSEWRVAPRLQFCLCCVC